MFLNRTEFAGDKPKRKKRRELTEDQKHEIKEAFDLFDTDKDKEIDYHELKVSEGKNGKSCVIKIVECVMKAMEYLTKYMVLCHTCLSSYDTYHGLYDMLCHKTWHVKKAMAHVTKATSWVTKAVLCHKSCFTKVTKVLEYVTKSVACVTKPVVYVTKAVAYFTEHMVICHKYHCDTSHGFCDI